MNIAIYCKNFHEKDFDFFKLLFSELEKYQFNLCIYEPFYDFIKDRIKLSSGISIFKKDEELKKNIDCLFGIGGDGTILETITVVKDSGIPILGINIGKLGFLSSVSKEQIKFAVDEIANKKYSLDQRSLIQLESQNNLFGELNYALNEFCIHKKDTPFMIRIQAFVDNGFLNTYWADGLIIATPTGSTGYSLSCGGPIITPDVESFIVTPIATHNLTVRPLVISDKKEIKLKFEEENKNIMIGLDSRYQIVKGPIELILKKADFKINLVQMENQNFFSTIRNKLMWGMDIRNKI